MKNIMLVLELDKEHSIPCPECSMIIEFSGIFDEKEDTKCPWCGSVFTVERKYQ